MEAVRRQKTAADIVAPDAAFDTVQKCVRLYFFAFHNSICVRLNEDNAIKLIENALKEARQGAFRVRNCHDFEKMCMPNRRRRSA